MHETDGPAVRYRSLSMGVRFVLADGAADGAADGVVNGESGGMVSVTSPIAEFEDKGRWEAIGVDAMGSPTAIQWQLMTSDVGVAALGGATLVPPHSALIFTMRLDQDEGTLLCDGKTWAEVAGDLQQVGTCEATPMPLMGNN